MEFMLKKSNLHHAFEYEKDGHRLAEITWVESGGVMTMDHTYVSDELRGQGVAKKLLDEAVNYARTNRLKMKPVCSYVVAVFEKSEAYDDVKV